MSKEPSTPAFRRMVGNLDFENQCRSGAGSHLPDHVLQRISELATLLRVFTDDEDRVWTPRELSADALLAVPGLSRPHLESGSLKRLEPASQTLAWGVTQAIETLQEGSQRQASANSHPQTSMIEAVWNCPVSDPSVAAAVNDRAFCLSVARAEKLALPGAQFLDSVPALEEHLRAGGARSAVDGRWVLKAPLSAAGRDRLLGEGVDLSNKDLHRRAKALFAQHGRLLFEPWMTRTLDCGCAAICADEGCQIIGIHTQITDSYGRIRSIELPLSDATPDALTREECEQLEDAAQRVAKHLIQQGYRGPFGIDAWRYLQPNGQPAFHALGEINARLTFGIVARALRERLQSASALPPGGQLRLHLHERELSATERDLPLVRSADSAHSSASLEIVEASRPPLR